MLTAATLCSGVGAPETAMPCWGWRWCAEIEPFPSAVLAARFGHPNLGDMAAPEFAARAAAIGVPDVIVAGTPCPSFSLAGKRGGLADDRGNLTLVFTRIVHDLAAAAVAAGSPRPCILWENVVGVLSTPDNAFGCFLGALVGADDALRSPLERGRWPDSGMVAGPLGRAAWTVKDAQHFGLAQRRERVFVVVDFGDVPDPAAVLFERKSREGDYSPRGKTREKPPARVAGAAGRGALWRAVAAAFADPRFGVSRIAGTLGARDGGGAHHGGSDGRHDQLIPEVTHSLTGGGFDASEDGTGRGTPLIPDVAWALQERAAKGADSDAWRDGRAKTDSPDAEGRRRKRDASQRIFEETAPTLEAGARHAVVAMNLRGREGGAMPELDDKASIRAADGGSSRSYVAFHGTQDPDVSGDLAPPLGRNSGHECALAFGWAVRRLTPVECARLQGFPDQHARIAWRGKPDHQCPDGPQYKAFGNAMAVPVIRWICERIEHKRLNAGSKEKKP